MAGVGKQFLSKGVSFVTGRSSLSYGCHLCIIEEGWDGGFKVGS